MARSPRFLLTLILCGITGHATLAAKPESAPISAGETLTYRAGWKAASAGTIRLQVVEKGQRQGRPAWKILATAETNSVVDRVFRVRDRMETWLDAREPRTLTTARLTREGPTQKDEFVMLDPASRRWTRRKYDLDESKNIKRSEGPLPAGPVVDAIGALYALRQRPPGSAQTVDLTVFENGKLVPIRLARRGSETLDTPAGQFRCGRWEPLFLNEGQWRPHPKATLSLWLSDDSRCWLVKMKGEFTFGSVDVTLDQVK